MAAKAKTPKFDALKWVSLAAAREQNRPVLTLAHWDANTSTLACADGYRLFVARGLTPPDNLVQGASGDSYVPLKKSHLGGIDGRFPDYSSIIPESRNYTITLNPARLSEAVQRAMIFARDNNNSVRFEIYPESNAIRVSGKSNERGDCETIVDCGIESPGKSISVAFDGSYVLDALTGFHDRVELSFKDDKSPLVIGDTTDHFALIMPMGLGWDRKDDRTLAPAPDVPNDPIERERYFSLPVNPAKSKSKKAKRVGGISAGGNIRQMFAGSPDAALRNDIYNALSLSAAAHGDPKVEWNPRESALTIELRSMSILFQTDVDGVARDNISLGRRRWQYHHKGLALSGDLVFNVAQAWHWDRLVSNVLMIRESTNFIRYQHLNFYRGRKVAALYGKYHPGTGIMSAFRKRARLLGA